MRQTAVEWLEQIAMNGFITPEDFEKAKEMEKQQIKSAYYTGGDDEKDNPYREAEQYYNDNYKKE